MSVSRAAPSKRAGYARRGTSVEPLAPLLKKLGAHKHGRGCLYLKRLSDVNLDVLRQVVEKSLASSKERWG